jgi:hypothetical protein
MHLQTLRLMEGFMKYAVKMGADIQNFIKNRSGIQTLIGGVLRHIDSKVIS